MVCKRRQAVPRQTPIWLGRGMAEMKLPALRQGIIAEWVWWSLDLLKGGFIKPGFWPRVGD